MHDVWLERWANQRARWSYRPRANTEPANDRAGSQVVLLASSWIYKEVSERHELAYPTVSPLVQGRSWSREEFSEFHPFKILKEMEQTKEYKKSCVYIDLNNVCRNKAAKDVEQLIQTAEELCQDKNCPSSRRRGTFLKKSATDIERFLYESAQQNLFDDLWTKANNAVFGGFQ